MKLNNKIATALCIGLLLIGSVGCSTDTSNDTTHRPENSQNNNVNDIMNSGKTNESSNSLLGENSNNPENKEVNLHDSEDNTTEKIDTDEILSQICEFRIIDCGQADSILIHSKSFNVLIDAGEEKEAKAIKKVLDNQGVKKIDILIATNPHSDHIGGMKEIIENYEIDKIIMSPSGHTSQTYEELLLVIESKGMTITKANPGDKYNLDDLKIEVIGPCSDYDDLNDDSVVILASYGDIDVLLTGDAGLQAEKDYVEYLEDIEILKVGHHGSDTSTSDNLLDITTPEVAAISCGQNNKYGHPNQETLDKLVNRNVQVYRTDESGDIIVRTNGIEYSVETENGVDNYEKIDKPEINNSQDKVENTDKTGNNKETVYVSKTGKKYHSTDQCSRLYTSKEINEMTEQEAINKGIEKCSKCW